MTLRATINRLKTRLRNWLRVRFGRITTKHCPSCGSDVVIPLRSINLKICNSCKREFPWTLSEGQRPVVASSRADRKVRA